MIEIVQLEGDIKGKRVVIFLNCWGNNIYLNGLKYYLRNQVEGDFYFGSR